MALVTCPDCGKSVSDAAITCIECGRPMRSALPTGEAPVLIEQTGKQFKLWMLVGICMAIGGFFFAAVAAVPGVLICVAGILLFIGSLLGAWWQHG